MPDFISDILGGIWRAILEFYFPSPRPDSIFDAIDLEGTYLELFGAEFGYVEAATIKLGVTAAVLIGLFWFMVFLVKTWWKRRNRGSGGGMSPSGPSPIRRRTDR